MIFAAKTKDHKGLAAFVSFRRLRRAHPETQSNPLLRKIFAAKIAEKEA